MVKKHTVHKFLGQILKKNKFSIRQNSIPQSLPLDWQRKSKENTLRICTLFKAENVNVVINADKTFVLFHMKENCLIVPTDMNRVGTATQVHNEIMLQQFLFLVSFGRPQY